MIQAEEEEEEEEEEEWRLLSMEKMNTNKQRRSLS
jgi:hypothetical protein